MELTRFDNVHQNRVRSFLWHFDAPLVVSKPTLSGQYLFVNKASALIGPRYKVLFADSLSPTEVFGGLSIYYVREKREKEGESGNEIRKTCKIATHRSDNKKVKLEYVRKETRNIIIDGEQAKT